MKRYFASSIICSLLLCLPCLTWAAANDNANTNNSELQNATNIVQHMTSSAADKAIPQEVIKGANCVAVVPKLIKAAIVVGGEHGTGVATCRTSNGQWSAPAPFSISGVSWGPQIGAKSTNLLMFIMNKQGMTDMLSGHFKVGGNASAAAGPVGREAAASAGWKAAILTYSSSKGLFVGASLKGAELQQDDHATKQWYGKDTSFKQILSGNVHMPNAQARAFVNAVQNAKESARAQ